MSLNEANFRAKIQPQMPNVVAPKDVGSNLDPLSLRQPAPDSPFYLKIYTLGRFAVYQGSQLIKESAWKRRKAKSLFKILLLAPGYRVLKDQVFEWLWPHQSPERAANNLHYTLFVLRRILQPDLTKATDSHYITFKDDMLILNKETIAWIDAEEFERLIRLGRQGNNLTHYEAARLLYQGDFLPEDLYEDWTAEQRERLKITYTHLLQCIARLYTQRNAFNEAIDCLQDILGVDATHEEAYRDLMRLYAQTGQRHQALHLYRQAYDLLQQELNAEPTPETKALYQTILEGGWSPSPQPAQTVIPLNTPANPLDATPPQPFIGREQEMHQLEESLQLLKGGCGTMTLISGEQGIGKTRLAQEIIWRAQVAGLKVLCGAAHEQEGHLPYGLFIEAIRSALNERSLDLVREKLGSLIKDLARILPELTEAGPPVSTPFELELGQERQRLFDAVAMTFIILAEETPLIIFLEDLHAAGESSLQLLHYLARRISKAPILILCTVREETIKRGSPIAQFCKEFKSAQLAQRINLSRLEAYETYHLCLELLGRDQLDPHLSQTLYNLTEGNPFFIHELVLNLKESGKLKENGNWRLPPNAQLIVPASVREVIGLRLERLNYQAYRLAGLAAVIGREFSHNLLQMAAQCDETALFDLLDELLGARLIEETETGYRFYHGLIRQVIYDELTTHRRAWLHSQVAQALEQSIPYQLGERAAILVHHFERAGQFEIAFRYLVRAGDWAKATYAPREALDYYNRAISLCRQHSQLAAGDAMVDLLKRRAQIHLALSDFDAAISDLEKLLDFNREIGNLSEEGEALYQVTIAHYWAHRLAKATAYLDQTLRLAKKINARELYIKSLKLKDILESTQGNIQQEKAAEGGLSPDEQQTLPPEEHWGRAMLAHLRSDFETATHHARACVELGQSLANTFLTLGGYFVLGMTQANSGDYQPALESLTYALDLSKTAEDRFWRARLLNTIGWIYRELFDLNRAIQFDEASLALARSGEPRLTEAEGNALANLATDYFLSQEYDRVRDYLTEGLTLSEDEPFMRWRYHTRMIVIKGELALVEGDASGALAAADEALTIARDTQARKNIARSCHLRGQTLLTIGQIDQARAALSHSLTISLSLKNPALIWPGQIALAQLEEKAGNLDMAQTHYFDAAETLLGVANHLTNPALYQPFLDTPQVQKIFAKAICPIQPKNQK